MGGDEVKTNLNIATAGALLARIVSCLAIGAVLCTTSAAQTTYSITDLGTLPGRTSSVAFGLNDMYAINSAKTSTAYGINDDGVVVGFGNAGTFIWKESYGMLDLQSLLDDSGTGWDLQQARAINDLGQIVGYGITNGQSRAFLLTPNAVPEPGSCILLGVLSLAVFYRRRS